MLNKSDWNGEETPKKWDWSMNMATVATRRNHLVTLADQVNTILENARDLIMSSQFRVLWFPGSDLKFLNNAGVSESDINKVTVTTCSGRNKSNCIDWLGEYCLSTLYCTMLGYHIPNFSTFL